MRPLLVLPWIAVAVCGGRNAPPADGAAAASGVPSAGAPTAAPAPAALARQGRPTSPAVRAVCDGVARFWRKESDTVRVVDSLLTPWTDDTAVDACVVQVYQEHGMRRANAQPPDTGAVTMGPVLALARGTGPGWIPLYHYSADGPDGTVLGYQRGTVRCLVQESWDGGDDSDTTYVPADWFREVTTCWLVPGGIAPSDTGR